MRAGQDGMECCAGLLVILSVIRFVMGLWLARNRCSILFISSHVRSVDGEREGKKRGHCK
jgi:hypothetical protein